MKMVLKVDNFLIAIGILLIIGFAIRLGADYYQIQIGIRSAPFNIFLLERILEFLLPSALCFAVAIFIKRHNLTNRRNWLLEKMA